MLKRAGSVDWLELAAEFDERLKVLNEPGVDEKMEAVMRARGRMKKPPKAGESIDDLGFAIARAVTGQADSETGYSLGGRHNDLRKTTMSDDEQIRQARLRGKALVSRILAEPVMLDLKAFAARAGMTAREVQERWARRELLVLESPSTGPRFPEWQLGPDGRPLPAIAALFGVLSHTWAVYRFLMQHHPELNGQTGLEAIASGHSGAVINTAQGILEGNFS